MQDEVCFTPNDVTIILPKRYLAEDLRLRQVEAWAALGNSKTTAVSKISPWHFVVLEDLGFPLEFPIMTIEPRAFVTTNLSSTSKTTSSVGSFTATLNNQATPKMA